MKGVDLISHFIRFLLKKIPFHIVYKYLIKSFLIKNLASLIMSESSLSFPGKFLKKEDVTLKMSTGK